MEFVQIEFKPKENLDTTFSDSCNGDFAGNQP